MEKEKKKRGLKFQKMECIMGADVEDDPERRDRCGVLFVFFVVPFWQEFITRPGAGRSWQSLPF